MVRTELIIPISKRPFHLKMGLRGVKNNDKWGFINTDGRIVIPPTYKPIIELFEKGLAKIRKYGVRNSDF